MKDKKITMIAVGDIMLARSVGDKIRDHGADYPFVNISTTLKKGDIVFGNLESPISNKGQTKINSDPNTTFRASVNCIEGLVNAGFNVLSIANNHICDYGDEALLDTKELLQKKGIKTVGAGENELDARCPQIICVNDIKIGFLAYHQLLGTNIKPASRKKPGVSQLIIDKCLYEVRKLRNLVDIVVVSVHWGMDYYEYPSPHDMFISRLLIDNGCNIIIGHHSHVVQGYEKYNNGLIFYGLGNFLFDEPYAKTKYSILLKLILDKNGIVSHDIIPIHDKNTLQPSIASEQVRDEILFKINYLSNEYKLDHWQGEFNKDPTDRIMFLTLKLVMNYGGSIMLFKNYPLKLWLQRLPHQIVYIIYKIICYLSGKLGHKAKHVDI